MKIRQYSVVTAGLLALSAAAALADVGDIIPLPAKVAPADGTFVLSATPAIGVNDPSLTPTAQVLADLLAGPLGVKPEVTVATQRPSGSIYLTTLSADPTLGDEGYTLTVRPDGVVISASSSTGLFYGVQSLRQLLPPQVESKEKVASVKWSVPCGEIRDMPRYAWRGLMLDASRHFFDAGEVERVLDVMALHKMNVFHWHLSDDQGWRVEIKKHPELTEKAAWRAAPGFKLDPKRSEKYVRPSDGKYGGFYTQDDIRRVVAYAAARHITVVPEVDVPGHSTAALSVYPHLSSGPPPAAPSDMAGVLNGILDPSNEETFSFLDDVFTELASLFPGPYLHVGGDEVPKGPWKSSEACQALIKKLNLKDEAGLQSYFMKRVQTIVAAKGKRMIGWDEILEGGLAPGASVMSWRGTGGAVEAASQGHDVVLSPFSHAYLDYAQTRAKDQPRTMGGYLPISKVYSFNPMPAKLSPDKAKHVLGAQGNVWTEYIPNLQQIELMAFPRAFAIAEVTWTPQDRREFGDFQRRLDLDKKRLDVLGIDYYRGVEPAPAPPVGDWKPNQMSTDWHPLTWDVTRSITKPGKYSVTFQYTGGDCRLDVQWAALRTADGKETARDTHSGSTGAADRKNVYVLDVPDVKAGDTFTLVAQTRSDEGTDSTGVITITAP